MSEILCACARYVRSHIISSDYEGCVTLWDVDTQATVNEYEAHDKRIWSVDYSTADPLLFVSGSDDGFIKVALPRLLHSCLPPASVATCKLSKNGAALC